MSKPIIPSHFIHPDWIVQSEKQGCLSPELLDLIYQEKWFKLFVPKKLDGLGLTLPEALKLEENIARLDASLGWTVTLCAGAGWFVGFLEKGLAQEVFTDPKVCLAGSGYVGGKANLVGDKFEISGSWTYASGALHATHFTANCEILKDGNPQIDKKGNPIVKAFILQKEEVEVLDGWSYMGMIATGSHAFKATNLVVPSHRAFEILPEKVTRPESIYRFPFLQFAETTLVVNILGISFHLQELIMETFWNRAAHRSYTSRQLKYAKKLEAKSKEKLATLQKRFYKQVQNAWDQLAKDGKVSKKNLKAVSHISRKVTSSCRELNARLYPLAGLEAAKTHTELNRVWRDFQTVSQHSLLIFPF